MANAKINRMCITLRDASICRVNGEGGKRERVFFYVNYFGAWRVVGEGAVKEPAGEEYCN